MFVHSVIIIQKFPHTEHIDSIFAFEEDAQDWARELEQQLPTGFEANVESFELIGIPDEGEEL